MVSQIQLWESSSMDWAKEYGFKNYDGAKRLYKNAEFNIRGNTL